MILNTSSFLLGAAMLIISAVDNSVWLGVIGAFVALTSAVSTVVTVISNNRTKRMEIMQTQNHATIEKLEKNTDGMTGEIARLAKAAGISEGKETQRAIHVEAQANVDKGKAEQKAL